MSDMRTMVKVVDIAAPSERVFQAVTHADELGAWMAMSAESDPIPGGAFALTWTQFGMTGTYGEITPNERVVAKGDGWESGMASIVTWELEPRDGETRVRLTVAGVAGPTWDAMYDGVSAGWDLALRDLKEWVETGQVQPDGFRSS